jgi:hypothetical protein
LDFNEFRLIVQGLAIGFQWISVDFEGLGHGDGNGSGNDKIAQKTIRKRP